jgi:protein SCO1/2
MRRMPRIAGWVVCSLALAMVSAPQAAADDPPKAGGARAGDFGKITLRPHDDKGLSLLDNGEVNFYEELIKGKIVVINFMYTRCDGKLCGKGMENLVKVQEALGDHLGKDVFMYSITLDPGHDTPAVLKDYAEGHKVKPGWTFLSGRAEDINHVRRKLGLFASDPKTDEDLKSHTGMIKIGNDAINKWTSTSVLASPERILQMIDRVTPPMAAKLPR